MLTNTDYGLSYVGTGLFGLAVSVWPFRSGRFGLSRFGLSHFGLADSVWPIRTGRFGHGTFRSD